MGRDMAADDREPGHAIDLPVFKDDEIDLSDLRWEDSIVLAVFWILAVVVFLQFFTRYVLNDSLGWTEEIARYLLIGVTFIGAAMAVRKQSHVAVEFLYRWVPRRGRIVAQAAIDVIAVVFYLALAWFSAGIAMRTNSGMVSIKVPKSIIYWGVSACFVAMAIYAVIVAWRHWKTRTSPLIDPDAHAAHVLD
jgi:TRAP-type C4-dicarboxylate transport system permease small subunit